VISYSRSRFDDEPYAWWTMHDHRHDSDTAEGQVELDSNAAYRGSLVATKKAWLNQQT